MFQSIYLLLTCIVLIFCNFFLWCSDFYLKIKFKDFYWSLNHKNTMRKTLGRNYSDRFLFIRNFKRKKLILIAQSFSIIQTLPHSLYSKRNNHYVHYFQQLYYNEFLPATSIIFLYYKNRIVQKDWNSHFYQQWLNNYI